MRSRSARKEAADAAKAAADAEPPADGEPPAEEEEKPPLEMVTKSYRQGKGTYVFKPIEEGEDPNLSGGYYEGEFVDNKKHGHGVMVFPDKSKYEGDFVRDVMHGRGRYEYPSGDFYVGAFAEGKKHGFGDYFFAASMSTFMGRWEKGAFVEGEWVLKDGSRYEARLKTDAPSGGRVHVGQDGNSQSGAWGGSRVQGWENHRGARRERPPRGESRARRSRV